MTGYFKKLFFIAILLFAFFGCKKEKEPDQGATIQTDRGEVTDSAAVVPEVKEGAGPEWFRNPPQRDDFVYSVGEASSKRPEMARNRAIMNAQVLLAQEMAKQFGELKPDSLEQVIRFSRVIKEKQIKKGSLWHSYVLLEAPLKNKTD
ncbi:MAG: hypothetical protein GXO77_12425 [Calditrichaeota bacterium]|nr:hypothetical protein [Calditrichota bacterium]